MVIKVHALTVAQKECVVHIKLDGRIQAMDATEALEAQLLIYALSRKPKVRLLLI